MTLLPIKGCVLDQPFWPFDPLLLLSLPVPTFYGMLVEAATPVTSEMPPSDLESFKTRTDMFLLATQKFDTNSL